MADFFQWLSSGSTPAIIFIAIVVVLITAIVLIFLTAFIQGREISLYPPKIGERPATKKNTTPKPSIDKSSSSSTKPSIDSIFITEPPSFDEDALKAINIYILGMNLRRTLTNYYGMLETKLCEGGNLKFLLVDPKCDAIPIIAARNYVYRDAQKLAEVVESTLDTLYQLQCTSPARGTIEVRILRHVPSYGLLLLDSELPKGRIRVDIYPYRVSPDTYPSFWVERKSDKKWFEFFRNQFFVMWEDATPFIKKTG
jgi:hypothetical protein